MGIKKAKQQIKYDDSVKIQDGENVIGTVKYTYDGRMVGSTDIIYDSSKSASHLDEASRQIVDSEIKQIKTNKKHAVILTKLSGIKYSFYNMVSFFKDRVILVIVAGLILLLIVLLVVNYRMNSRRKRRSRIRTRRSYGAMSLNSRKSLDRKSVV